MSEELSGSRLRTAALKAVGLYNRSLPVAMMDPCESSIAAAWPLLEKWRRKNKHREAVLILKENKTATCIVWGESDWGFEGEADAEKSDESAMATAICRALVAAAEETL